jgi:hypothetical protein
MKKQSIKSAITNTRDSVNLVMPGMLSYIQYCIDPFLTVHPYWGLAIYAVIGLYGVYLTLTQEALNEVIVFIKDHPTEFRKEIVESEEFRLGFVRFFDAYIKERLRYKRHILMFILLGFTTEVHKERFDLERLQDTLTRISPNALEQLVFIKHEILPVMETRASKNASYANAKVSQEDYEKVLDFHWAVQSVSDEIIHWFRRNYSSESLNIEWDTSTKENPNIRGKAIISNSKNEKFNLAKESWPELQSLGIFTVLIRTTSSNNQNINSYHLTKFGRRFLDYLFEEKLD